MAEYSANYTTNTTSYTFGTEVYKFSRTVDIINPSAIDNSCIYCGAENGTMYDYYPTYNLGTAEKAIMNNHWAASGGTFNFQKSAKPTPYNITFVKCGETGTANERGANTVYQIGKTIYNKASSAANSSMRVLNPTDIRKLIFRPRFYGYTASPSSTYTDVDLKYIMDHPDDFFVQDMTMNVYAWNGSTFTNDSEIQSIRPCIVGENYFIPVNNVLSRHIFGMTDYNSRRDYIQSFFGTYDDDNMPMSFVPILTDETLTYDPDGSSGGGATTNHNKWKWAYNYYNSSYEIHAPARQVLQLMAYCGCYFIDNSYSTSGKTLNTFWNDEHIYLGEMKAGARTTGNFIKGTDLLTSDTINKGEYSSQTDFNPSGGGGADGDDLDDIDLSAALYGAGMAHYYICTKASGVLDTISEAMGNLRFSEAGTNLFPNLISCKLFPSGTGAVPAVNSTFKIAGKELLDPDDEQPISIQEVTGSPSIIIEDIAIDRKFGDFRDYAPYTMIELYVPFCGWTALPSWSMGGTVSGKIIIDIIDGSCKAVIEVTKNGKKTPVAELSGCCSLDIPFTAENVGAKMAGIMSAMSASATAALESAVGVGTMTVTGGRSGGKSVISGLTSYAASLCQATLVNNQNYTQVTGRTGDGCNLGGVTDIVLKIQRPNTTEYSAPLYVPDGFAHAIGFMSMKQKKVSECTGLIICDNVDTSGISGATDEERAEIKRVLETGLYVNAAPE